MTALLYLPSTAGAAKEYEVTIIGPAIFGLENNITSIARMNDRGEVIAHRLIRVEGVSPVFNVQAIMWDKLAGTRPLMRIANRRGQIGVSRAFDINNNGISVGYGLVADTARRLAFRWEPVDDGFLADPFIITPFHTAAAAINDDNVVVGIEWFNFSNNKLPFIIQPEGEREYFCDSSCYPRAINNRSQVLGDGYQTPEGFKAFIWDGQDVVPIAEIQQAVDINNLGAVIGEDLSLEQIRGVLYHNGTATYLAAVPGYENATSVYGINDFFQIVGRSSSTAGETTVSRGFLHDDRGTSDLTELIDPQLGLSIIKASAINNSGQIAALAAAGDETSAVFLDPIFKRGNCNLDDLVDISDVAYLLNFLFQGGPSPRLKDACDVNDDEQIELTDAIRLLDFLYRGGETPAAPFEVPGVDPTF